MTQQLYLDPDRVAEWEPSEGDDRHRIWLSPYAVPRLVSAEHDADSRSLRVAFEYAGDEAAMPAVPLDDRTDPPVTLRTAISTQKVLELTVAPFDGPSDLADVAERFRRAARYAANPARRLSYGMTAEVLDFCRRELAVQEPADG